MSIAQPASASLAPGATLRAHWFAAPLAAYLAIHFSNHMFGWIGPAAHAAVMKVLRKVYRSSLGEPLLIGAFAFLIVSGVRMRWQLSRRRAGWPAQGGLEYPPRPVLPAHGVLRDRACILRPARPPRMNSGRDNIATNKP